MKTENENANQTHPKNFHLVEDLIMLPEDLNEQLLMLRTTEMNH